MDTAEFTHHNEEFFMNSEEKSQLKRLVCIGYSIEKADTRNISHFEISSHDFESRSGTQYFRFEVVYCTTIIRICKRFDQFRILHEELEAELRDVERTGMAISPPSYHVLPLLPESSISKVASASRDHGEPAEETGRAAALHAEDHELRRAPLAHPVG